MPYESPIIGNTRRLICGFRILRIVKQLNRINKKREWDDETWEQQPSNFQSVKRKWQIRTKQYENKTTEGLKIKDGKD